MNGPTKARFARLAELVEEIGCDCAALRKAIVATEHELDDLRRLLFPRDSDEALAENASLVFFGSLARGEFSPHSDLDWVLAVEGKILDQHVEAVQTVRGRLQAARKIEPCPAGMFGKIVSRDELVFSVGGQNDTKTNLSHRMLMLLESVSVGNDAARQSTVRAILQAYFAKDPGGNEGMLLDDVVRFGRTMAVDFSDADRDQPGVYWGLRNAKRRFSRKLNVLAGMLACFSPRLHSATEMENEDVHEGRAGYLEGYLSRPPLEILADELLRTNAPDPIRQKIFRAYDQFLGLLDDSRSRDELKDTPCDLADESPAFRLVDEISHEFQESIWTSFFAPGNSLSEVVRQSMQTAMLSNVMAMDAGGALAQLIAAHSEIGTVFFGEPQANPPLLYRPEFTAEDRQFIERAIERQADQKLTGWECCLVASEDIPEGVLRGVGYHQEISQSRFSVPAAGLSAEKIGEIAGRERPGRMLSICSQVLLRDGQTKHIPMMDFRCPKTKETLALVLKIVKLFGVGSGCVVETDKSFHFYGWQLLSESGLEQFLGRALLFSPIVDRAWIAHQLIDKCCALRISARGQGGKLPKVVGIVE